MSVQYDPSRARYVVRWREDGKQRVRRYASDTDAEAFDATINPAGRTASRGLHAAALQRVAVLDGQPSGREARDGVYAYATTKGVRWRLVFRQSDGTLTSRRGFASRTAALTARRRIQESVDRGEVKVCREDFATFWNRYVADRRAYMTAGSHLDLCTHGRKRLLPFFGADPLSKLDESRVREWLASMIERMESGELAPKTINNARTCLSVALNEAVRRGLIPRNPCDHVPALPLDRAEIEYLRLAEIQPYLDACADYYAVLAAFLIGTGARISEAVATRWPDLDLDQGVVRIYRQRGRTSHATSVTKGNRSARVLGDQSRDQSGMPVADASRSGRGT